MEMSQEELKREAARAALEHVSDGMMLRGDPVWEAPA
jgi:DeoR/GlpR family transcriptional regulator of sugar metabolism